MRETLITCITVIALVIGDKIATPQKKEIDVEKENRDFKKEHVDLELDKIETIKDSIINCIKEIEQSKHNIKKNEIYIQNLDTKIDNLKKDKK